jgi:uncharacterized protein
MPDSNSPAVLHTDPAAPVYDCDCACALSISQNSTSASCENRSLNESIPLEQPRRLKPVALQEGWQAYYNGDGPIGITVLNRDARRVLDAFDRPVPAKDVSQRLLDLSPHVVQEAVNNMIEIGLLRPQIQPASQPAQASALSAWLHVTEDCNLKCPYCYVRQRPRTMSLEVAHRAVDRLVEAARKHGYKTLRLKYAGGEPTLAFPLIQATHAYAVRQTIGTDLELEEVLLTNGAAVSSPVLAFCARAGIELMVSLDGDAATHDRIRASRNGRSTHALVINTIDRAIARGLAPTISITLSSLNLDGVLEAVHFALIRDLPFNLNFYRECVGADAEGPALLMPDPDELVDTMRAIFDLVSAYPAYPRQLAGILDRARMDRPHTAACSAGRDYMVIDPEGRVAACQMLLEEPWTDLEDDAPLDTLRERGEKIFRTGANQSCENCMWHTACAGGCPLMRGTELHAQYCRVYQALFPSLVRLEASRLLAAEAPPVES